MSNARPNITPQLKKLLEDKPRITEVHFDTDGNFHLNAYDEEKTIYNKDTGKVMVDAFGKAIKKKTGKTVAGGGHKYIVETLTRDEVLGAGETQVSVDGPKDNTGGGQPGSN